MGRSRGVHVFLDVVLPHSCSSSSFQSEGGSSSAPQLLFRDCSSSSSKACIQFLGWAPYWAAAAPVLKRPRRLAPLGHSGGRVFPALRFGRARREPRSHIPDHHSPGCAGSSSPVAALATPLAKQTVRGRSPAPPHRSRSPSPRRDLEPRQPSPRHEPLPSGQPSPRHEPLPSGAPSPADADEGREVVDEDEVVVHVDVPRSQ